MDTLWIVYLCSGVLGGLPLALSVLGALDEESLELDVEDLSAIFRFLAFFKPLRLMLFLLFFGLVGATFYWLYAAKLFSLCVGAGVGIGFGWAGEWIMHRLRDEVTDSALGERGLVGREAQVVLPLAADSPGKIRCNVDRKTVEVRARVVESEESFAIDDQVLIIDMEEGIALVARI